MYNERRVMQAEILEYNKAEPEPIFFITTIICNIYVYIYIPNNLVFSMYFNLLYFREISVCLKTFQDSEEAEEENEY